MTNKERVKTGTFREFQEFTLAVARGDRKVDPNEPKIWMERREGDTALSCPPLSGLCG